MVSQEELTSKGYHSLVPGRISIFIDGMGSFNDWFLCIVSFMFLPDMSNIGQNYIFDFQVLTSKHF